MGNYIIIGLVIVIIYFAVRSVIKRGKNGCCGGGSCSVHEVKAEDQDRSHYPFKAVHGVWGTVDLKSKTAEVRMKEEHTEMEIREWINKAGYGVSQVELEKI